MLECLFLTAVACILARVCSRFCNKYRCFVLVLQEEVGSTEIVHRKATYICTTSC